MYKELLILLRKKYDKAPMVMEAVEAIEKLSKPRWIPVTERLPEEWTNVMTYQPTIGQHNGLRRVGVYIGGDKWREAEHHNMMELPVTHWMPLPEPPLVMEAADIIEELAHRDARWEVVVVNTVLDFIPCWVSVSDRLPEDEEDVLCRLLDDNCEVCATVGRYSSTFKLWSLDAEWAASRHVTHWMPLPTLS